MLKVIPLFIGCVIFLFHAVMDKSEYDYFISGAHHMDLSKMNNDLSEVSDQNKVSTWLYDQPWTKSVTIRRQGLNDFFVDVTEHKPRAVWRFGGVISSDGVLFFPKTLEIPDELPVVDAPLSSVDRSVWFISELESDLRKFQLWPIRVFRMKAGDWAVELPRNRYFIFGTSDLVNRVKVCKKILPKLILSHKKWGRVDFRYPKAFAISENSL
ncbi:MAG: hypothetical protein CMF41_02555 [Legionellales bacterium]|jgi:cell division septal protein FtsQ|nr:hypothetical protein [Legionellales bacterium]OUX65723.1 MAG: hypothetical protein CBE41_01315 [Gammaproteobacteria bacterium TMED281]